MSDTTQAVPKKKSKLMGLLVPVIGGLVLIGGGAGGGFYLASSGLLSGGGAKTHHKKDMPQQIDANEDGRYETTYFELKKEFTSNLQDPNRYIQVGLGVATTYDANVTEAVEKNELAIRSAVLGVLAEQSADEISTVAGKESLQRRLRAVINKTLEGKTGFGGISQVYFTSFVIQ